MRYLATYEAQRRVMVKDYQRLSAWQDSCWLAVLTACTTPGIPIDDPDMQAQLQGIWGSKSETYHRLIQP